MDIGLELIKIGDGDFSILGGVNLMKNLYYLLIALSFTCSIYSNETVEHREAFEKNKKLLNQEVEKYGTMLEKLEKGGSAIPETTKQTFKNYHESFSKLLREYESNHDLNLKERIQLIHKENNIFAMQGGFY